MNIEDELRGALDVPAPPPSTTLEDVLKRGRRRVLTQRVGAMLGVVAVVAGIGFGAMTINLHKPPAPADDDVDYGPAMVLHDVAWPRVQVARRTPADPARPESGCAPAGEPNVGQEPQRAEKLSVWFTRLQGVAPEMQVTASGQDNVFGYEVQVGDNLGAGKVRLERGFFTGSPLDAANAAVWATGSCEPPQRTTDANGAVYQLYDPRAVPEVDAISQTLYVFRADGKVFRVQQLNLGLNSTRSTRPSLPLTQEQFAKLGPIIAEVA